MKSIYLFIFPIVLLLFACEKPSQPFTDTPVIESYLTPGQHPVVKIYRQIPFSSGVVYSDDNIDSLHIILSSETESSVLSPCGDSLYSDTTTTVKEGERYDISFVFNSKNVSAYTTVPSKPVGFTQSASEIYLQKIDSTSGFGGFGEMPDPVKLTWTNADTSYYIVVVENIETDPEEVRETSDTTRPANMFRERPTRASGLELRPMEFRYFGKHRIILFHVLPDYASLYDNNNTSSSQNLTNPSTSITNGYGIFTGLNSDTLFVQVKKSTK